MNRPPEHDPLAEPERYELSAVLRYRFGLDRRTMIQALGGGLVVALAVRESGAQPPGRRGRGGEPAPRELSAWLHIEPSGEVAVYTGKVEVGQNIRTSLAQAVAEELLIPPGSIRLIMADTDRVPFDSGTAGSRSTPSMAPQLRKAAAFAREWLIELAAAKAGVDRSTLAVGDGRIVHSPTSRSYSYADLTDGQKLTKTIEFDPPVIPADEWKVLGTSVEKVDGRAMVTGKHKFASDVGRDGMWHGKVLRPPTLHSTLASVDLSAAQALPDVVVVHDGSFVGAAAPTAREAEAAIAAVRAEWNDERRVSDATLFNDLRERRQEGSRGSGGRGNDEAGSVERGLARADVKLEASYTVAYIAHAPLETRAAVAEWSDRKLTVWTGTQRPFGVRGDLAAAFGLPQDQVRVIVPDTGSGYGGKHTVDTAIEAARLARAAGRPVKVAWSREEEFTWAYFRPAGLIEVSAGATSDGLLAAWEMHNTNSGGSSLATPYDVSNRRTVFHGSQAPLAQGSYRALAATANCFARECHMDDLAHALRIDPLEFRLKNLKDPRMIAVLKAASEKFGWGSRGASDGRGFGIACGTEKASYVATCAEVIADRDAGELTVVRLTTAFECGAIVNPRHLTNQVEGAVVMGLGGALFEAVRFEEGRITTDRFSRYRVPRIRDMPILETVLVDRRDAPSAGAGETPIIAVAPAIGNAVFRAGGPRLRSLPMVPDGLKG
jgi:isoquinoline 1-oxidoreductase